MPENDKKSIKGVKAQTVNAVLMISGCLLALFVFTTSLSIKNRYDVIVESMNDYSECNKAIYELRDASDFLTNQARLFAINQDITFLQNYFFEYRDLKRRESALDIVELTHQGDSPYGNVLSALTECIKVSDTELYAMKLVCDAINLSGEYIPEEIKAIELAEEDKLLIEEAKISKAKNLLFGREYFDSKDRVSYYSNNAITDLVYGYITEQNANDVQIRAIFWQQTIFIALLFVVCIGLYFVVLKLLLIPLYNNYLSIQKGTKMKLKGAYEVKYIATAYNALCDKNAITASVLKHRAEHDPLTGLINRNAFGQIKDALRDSDEPIAFLIIDIDLFKHINDEYGHLVGDEVLKMISSMLMEQFRATDYVARIGGDEFAVIMTKFGLTPVEIIERKISELNTRLQTLEEGMPPVSLSVGVAFSECGYNLEVEEKADKALYNVKRGGRCNCSFYDK